ncbi:MAG: ribonuclease III [Clostridia bacterium]|nr:ribonuclease III [Clostridia bacterium]
MIDISQISAQALAYLGDAVIELMVREHLILKGYEKSGRLNAEARKFVTAVAQNKAYLAIENLLTEQECDVFRRAKNSSHLNIPKSASALEYKNATGLEAIFGLLQLKKDTERLRELFAIAYKDILE